MSLDKAIETGKEHRKQYRGAKAYFCSCRNHGKCSWCLGTRTFTNKKRGSKSLFELKMLKNNSEIFDS